MTQVRSPPYFVHWRVLGRRQEPGESREGWREGDGRSVMGLSFSPAFFAECEVCRTLRHSIGGIGIGPVDSFERQLDCLKIASRAEGCCRLRDSSKSEIRSNPWQSSEAMPG